MKKSLALLLILLLLAPSFAAADVIVVPENSFFAKHQDECQLVEGRTFLADGPEGKLDLYAAPGGTVIRSLSNGASFYCMWLYTDEAGTVWGYAEEPGLWTMLGYTRLRYDYIAFAAEHGSAFSTAADRPLAPITAAAFYRYPGASTPFIIKELPGFEPEQFYTDEAGRLWGFSSYCYGARNVWVCLDDPTNETLSGEEPPSLPSPYSPPATAPAPAGTGLGTVIGLVAAVVLVTLGAVLLLFRRKKAV